MTALVLGWVEDSVFDPIAECSELQDHFRRALLLGLFRDGGPCGWRIVIFSLPQGM
jgi:hypothetical protein